MASTALITGGAGFIGSHLAHRLTAEGCFVRIVDDLSTGRKSNLDDLNPEQFELIVGDAADYISGSGALDGIDVVYHLAAAVGVKLIVDQPAAMIRNNVEKAAVILEACTASDVPILIASSSEVYGKCPTLPLREDMDLVFGPSTASRWSYGMTKALDEHLALDLHRQHGLRPVIVRLFNTIGPRQVGHYGMVVPRFVQAACAGEPLTIYGDGNQTRAFCDVRDVADAMVKLMEEPKAVGRVCNVGNASSISISGLADTVIDLVGELSQNESAATKQFIEYKIAYGEGFEDPPHRLPDISRLRELIDFSPRFDLRQTLSELIASQLGTALASSAEGAK